MAGTTASTGVASSPWLFPLQKTRSASSQRTWRLPIRSVSIREDAYNDRAPQTDGRRFAENERGVRLGWLGALQNYTIDFDPAPRASLSLSLALPKGNRRAYPVSFYESVEPRHAQAWPKMACKARCSAKTDSFRAECSDTGY
jgi:hypothetical protein